MSSTPLDRLGSIRSELMEMVVRVGYLVTQIDVIGRELSKPNENKITIDVKMYPCRYNNCDHKQFKSSTGRCVHERKIHGAKKNKRRKK